MSEIPDLRLITAKVRAEDAEASNYVKDLALLNLEAYLRYIAPHVPKHLLQEHFRCVDDIEFALKIGAAA